ncbi:unnamed protein product [Brassicogethes aeneus]|uniref:PBZ-type domain-containing protein n=1 Tax=Brassicogethes aeneus TaxID=1431903 RepID=A0A9P0AVV0_BRAAE|nr:unnamed protein product [Brassicogethes aeneus]
MLKIYKLDDVDFKEALSSLPFGEHVIGRGPLLKVNDKRISRNHAVIKYNGKATITALHINPCYFKSAQSKSMTILPLNKDTPLADRDCFALLTEDNFWFRVRLLEENVDKKKSPKMEETSLGVKREADSDEEESSSKKARITDEHLDTLLGNISRIVQENKENTVNSNEESGSTSKVKEENDEAMAENSPEDISRNTNTSHTNKEIVSDDEDDDNDHHDVNMDSDEASASKLKEETPDKKVLVNKIEVKNEPTTEQERSKENDNPSTSTNNNDNGTNNDKNKQKDDNKSSTSKPRRERCWYGTKCFRKNPQHKADFSHQGDDDYDSDPEDDRPVCSFGAACYRRNLEHRRQHRHPNRPAARPTGGNVNIVFTRHGCQFCKHCNSNTNNNRKPGYESD